MTEDGPFDPPHEIGALTPDMTVHLSRILLGEHPGQERRGKRPRPAEPPPGPAGGLGKGDPRGRPSEARPSESRRPRGE